MTGPRARPTAGRRFGVRGAVHDYSGVVVLRDVDFEMVGGTVHGLVGENGCGKSTLIKVLTGAVRRAAGELYLDDDRIELSSPADAQAHGIGVVHQDYHLFPHLTVTENVFGPGGGLPRRRLTRTVDRRAARAAVAWQLDRLGIDISPQALVGTLGPVEKKFVEIARAMLRRPSFLILDEPTASLEPQAAEAVLELLDRLRSQGVGLAIVSHRLDEILRVADSVTVLRDGRRVAKHATEELDEARLINLIVSEEGGTPEPPRRSDAPVRAAAGAPPVLRVRDLRLRRNAEPMSFAVARGEILGLVGLLGAGPARVVRLIAGAESRGIGWGVGGSIEVNGRAARIRDPRAATALGIGYIPEDRKRLGLVPDASVATNISLASLGAVSRFGLVDARSIRRRADECREAMRIRTSSIEAPVSTLSGGNQQKVLIARWISSGIDLLAIEEPTHGVDVGGKAHILQLLRDYADKGGSIVVASTEARDLLELCDRIAVLRHGELVETLTPASGLGRAIAPAELRAQQERLEQLMVGETAGASA